MPFWSILAISAALCWAITNILDKILLTDHVRGSVSYLILASLVGLISVVFILVFGGEVQQVGSLILALSLMTGVLNACFLLLYFKALQHTDASVVAILIQMIPVSSLVIGFFVFSERFSAYSYFGIIAIVAGTVLASFGSNDGQSNGVPKALLLMIPAVIFASTEYALESYALRFTNVDTVFIWGRIGQFFFAVGVFLCLSLRKKSARDSLKVGFRVFLMIVAVECLNLLGIYLLNGAYALGPYSLVVTLSSIQPILVLILILLFRQVVPQLVPDVTTKSNLLARIVASMSVIIGVFLISSA